MTLGIGILGLGSVSRPYGAAVSELVGQGRARLVAGWDPNSSKRAAFASATSADTSMATAEELLEREDVDLVLVLTSMKEHGALSLRALRAGKHVLVEKPLATTTDEARELLAASNAADGLLLCAPHVVLSPTYRKMLARVRGGAIGVPVLARARYGWSGPTWGKWFYEEGGGSLFDLGVYNLVSLCGFLGSVRRVTALVGTAIPERLVDGQVVCVTSDDNAQVLLDFGQSRFGVITTGFTMQKYRSPAIELYGTTGVLQMMGDDWAPQGFEEWQNATQVWEIHEEEDPSWRWTAGLRHLVECIESETPLVPRPEHAFHVLEVMLAAQRSAREGQVVQVESEFPSINYASLAVAEVDDRRGHDARSLR